MAIFGPDCLNGSLACPTTDHHFYNPLFGSLLVLCSLLSTLLNPLVIKYYASLPPTLVTRLFLTIALIDLAKNLYLPAIFTAKLLSPYLGPVLRPAPGEDRILPYLNTIFKLTVIVVSEELILLLTIAR